MRQVAKVILQVLSLFLSQHSRSQGQDIRASRLKASTHTALKQQNMRCGLNSSCFACTFDSRERAIVFQALVVGRLFSLLV